MLSHSKKVAFSDLQGADLLVDALYESGRKSDGGADPLPRLLGVSSRGGFRYRGSMSGRLSLVALTSSLEDPDWPDQLDREAGQFVYFGDNKMPGEALHSTKRKGNLLLQRVFEHAGQGRAGREQVPPIFIFTRGDEWHDLVFSGLAVPGVPDAPDADGLTAIWRTNKDKRFQNYRAVFTILNATEISAAWIADLVAGKAHSIHAPKAWTDWQRTGRAKVLRAPRVLEHRTKQEQLPKSAADAALVAAIHGHFSKNPHGFEHCAAAIVRMVLPGAEDITVTRGSRDGGRDGVGYLRLGQGPGAIRVDFAIEAKCYGRKSAVGVAGLSRLISRLRHRQFGLLVTTSYLDEYAYKELKEDRHPIIVISAADLANVLRANGVSDAAKLGYWLAQFS